MRPLLAFAILPLIVTFLPVISGAASAIISGANLYFTHLRKLNSFKELREGLDKIKRTPASSKLPDKAKLIEQWLVHGELIVGPLKQRLMSRFLVGLITILGISITAYAGLREGSVPPIYIDIGLIGGQLLVVLGSSTKPLFLEPEEKEFLSNLSALYRGFYMLHVLPAIREFNAEMKNAKPLREIVEWNERENKQIEERVRDETHGPKHE